MFNNHRQEIIEYIKNLYIKESQLKLCLTIHTPFKNKFLKEIENVSSQIASASKLLDSYNNI